MSQFEAKYEVTEYNDLYEKYEHKLRRDGDPETTRTRLLAGARLWFSWCEEQDLDPYEVNEQDVRFFIAENRLVWGDSTMHRRVTTIRQIYDWLQSGPRLDKRYQKENPVEDIDLVDKNIQPSNTRIADTVDGDDDILAISPDTVEELVDAVEGQNKATRLMRKLIIRMLWDTGMRSKELSWAKWKDVEPDKRQLEVKSAKINDSKHNLYRRYVWWTPETHKLLKKWLTTYRSTKSDYADESPYLIPTEHGEQISSGTVSRTVKQAAHNAGVNEPLLMDDDGEVDQWLITGHRLRHSRITYLANETDLDINTIRMMAGHSKIETTMQYVHKDWDVYRQQYRRATE